MPEVTGVQVNGGSLAATTDFDTKNGVKMLSKPPKISNTSIKRSLSYQETLLIRTDPTVKLVKTLVIAPAVLAGWSVDADDSLDPAITEAVKNTFVPMHTHVMQTALIGNMEFGFTPYEKVYEYDEFTKRLELRKLKPLLQPVTNILVDKHGRFQGLRNYIQVDPNTSEQYVDLELEDCLLLYQNVEGTNWYGEADYVATKRVCDKYEVVENAADRYDAKVTGTHWVVYYPANQKTQYKGTLTDNYDIAVDILNQIESSGKMVIPVFITQMISDMERMNDAQDTGWRIEMIESSGSGNTQMIERMEYLDKLKVRSLGFPERSVLEGQHGTLAEAEVHGDMATMTINTRRIDITLAVNWHCVNQYLRLNWGREYENKVRLVPNPIGDISAKFLQNLYNTLVAGSQLSVDLQRRIDTPELSRRLKVPIYTETELKKLPPLPEVVPANQPPVPGQGNYVPPAKDE